MAVHIKCSRPYNIEALKAIMERCGGRGPSPPRCPPMGAASNMSPRKPTSNSYFSSSSMPRDPCTAACTSPRQSRSAEAPSCPVPCMTCPPTAPAVPPRPPCPFVCPPCTGYPCITCAPLPKPVPAPREPPRPVVRTLINCGGLFYTGTTIC